jgi:hypothetical protein
LLTESVLDVISTTISENETITSSSLEFDTYGKIKFDTVSSSAAVSEYESQNSPESDLLTETVLDGDITFETDVFSTAISDIETITSASLEFDTYGKLKFIKNQVLLPLMSMNLKIHRNMNCSRNQSQTVKLHLRPTCFQQH